MSTATRPRRRLPARVYWVRRTLVLVVALVLVLVVARLLGGGSGGSGPSAQPVAADASPSATGSAGGSAAPTAGPTSTPTVTATVPASGATGAAPSVLASPEGPCAADDVSTTPGVKGQAYAGRKVVFQLTLTTHASPACTWTVSPRSVVVRISSGEDRLWSTQECPDAVKTQSVVVRKDVATTVTVAWNGQRSDEECSRSTPWAEPGYYHVTAATLGSEPADTQFLLQSPPRPTITATPSPSEPGSASAAPGGTPGQKKSGH